MKRLIGHLPYQTSPDPVEWLHLGFPYLEGRSKKSGDMASPYQQPCLSILRLNRLAALFHPFIKHLIHHSSFLISEDLNIIRPCMCSFFLLHGRRKIIGLGGVHSPMRAMSAP